MGVGVGVGVGEGVGPGISRFDTVTTAVEELFAMLVSVFPDVTEAVLLSVVPSATVALTLATNEINAVEFGANEAKVTVRAFPFPPQVPKGLAEQVTNVVPAGRVSLTTVIGASPGPLLNTVML